MSRAFVLYAHPCAESFGAALHGAVVEGMAARGWEVDDCDLYAEGFDPVLTEAERRGYHELETNTAPVQGYVDRLRSADTLALVFPVWNYGYPAILKGFFDRVFLPGVSFRMEGGVVVPNLTHIERLLVVTTYGGTWLKSTLAGDPPRRVAGRVLSRITQAERVRYLALYDMNRADAAKRGRFLEKVRREVAGL
ncbi:MAG: NAD(P)H-dependent oxidoreductase [Rhodobacteraceae bacterium]|nr:NAD(P)H-dependent oxidoreductase [Paracoccaceae bacterium]